MLEYFAGIVTYRETEPARKRDCDVLLVQGSRSAHPYPRPALETDLVRGAAW